MDGEKLTEIQQAFSYIVAFIDESITKGGLDRKSVVIVNECINKVASELELSNNEEVQLKKED